MCESSCPQRDKVPVCSRSPKSERALLSRRVFCNFAPPPPPSAATDPFSSCRRVFPSWHGGVRALQAARSFSCILCGCHETRWAPFNPISEIHSDVGSGGEEKRGKEIKFFISPPVRHLPISLEVKEWQQLTAVGRRRHQRWHQDSVFQASGGITRGRLLHRR